jgi:uncharacterized protein YjgD (DUF1641 family)
MNAVEALQVDTRLEVLTEQVQLLVDEAEERRRLKESYSDLMHDLNPIASQGMESVTRAMVQAQERGYVDFARSGLGVVDRVVTNFTEEDVEALGDNVVLILETVKEMTQPEIMQMMRTTLHEVGEVEEDAVPPSVFALLRQMREPEVRRGLARMLALLRSMGSVEQKDLNKGKEARQ